GEIVAHDFRTAALFSKLGIDFCCRGHRTIEEVSQKKGLDATQLQRELDEILQKTESGSIDFKSWPRDLLAAYVEKTHHRYIEEKAPGLLGFLHKLCKVHGERQPELFEINILFTEAAQDLAAHLKKEALILFPSVRKMVNARITGKKFERPQFGT